MRYLTARGMCVLMAAAVLVGLPGRTSAGTLDAHLAFTVPTESTPWALSYSEAANEWAVLYRDAGIVRFYDSGGTLLRTHQPDLSNLSTYPGSPYDNPRVIDVVHGAMSPSAPSATQYQALIGNPDASPPPGAWVYLQGASLQIQLPRFDSAVAGYYDPAQTTLQILDPAFRMSRYETRSLEDGGYTSGVEVGLGHEGRKLFLAEVIYQTFPGTTEEVPASIILSLPDRGIAQAQSATFRHSDFNPVVLHDNQFTVLLRRLVGDRSDEIPYTWDTSWMDPADIGTVLEHYDILGLPIGAQLIDLDQVRPTLWPNADGDTFYVLDQVGGGVYRLVPEPGSLALLGIGMAALAIKRRRT